VTLTDKVGAAMCALMVLVAVASEVVRGGLPWLR